jgi:hypothetical protein
VIAIQKEDMIEGLAFFISYVRMNYTARMVKCNSECGVIDRTNTTYNETVEIYMINNRITTNIIINNQWWKIGCCLTVGASGAAVSGACFGCFRIAVKSRHLYALVRPQAEIFHLDRCRNGPNDCLRER